MIARLCGTIVSKTIDQVIVDVNGVGYQVSVPLSSFYQLEENQTATLQIYTHVREDALQLFGFQSLDEKQMFILLLSISGIGPKVALNILSHMDCHALRDCLLQEDAKRLATLPGIGKKTADRLILELREKVRKLYPEQPQTTQAAPEGVLHNNHHDDALSALINLGYKEKQASAALSRLTREFSSMEEMLKAALQQLSQ
ncbi:Holliday junction branch migration protein RuvA [Desulfuromonas acetoxidans]|uniref:Holliday junction branch migration complex subunit RuvA n=1 Tax=Desulfuromonas acetoxidans (strain DSM 684 / 11070) TaxID=281689 RepID=Q1JW71_DESA6|nr:Holliday junction branch migration protein RuvA [Desulfuromonas acetoxidans]EAT14497.1 Holliday junction DNA helicase RuvA [Desulfuromonas acetoxidans DSM 684]MBF0646239.1 Holliday junction branch migration protein RuvA [Desulfuromonas acetoxidans]NVD25083.1 Holliday junction branch migration protein RuvA [Desulfuromonas acetoxidans]NVE17128.1 Holliday junction branch migration protein RuvA [Desulfuromonas acetoxidans]